MKFLAIDYGTKNIGLAKASSGVSVVFPYGRIENTDVQVVIGKLAQLISNEKIDTIVVGLPTGLDGSENTNTAKVRTFAESLKKEVAIPTVFMSEIFSSQVGDRMGQGVSRDEKAAMVILQSYLEQNHQ